MTVKLQGLFRVEIRDFDFAVILIRVEMINVGPRWRDVDPQRAVRWFNFSGRIVLIVTNSGYFC